jgi:hypothetical protein
VVPIRFAICFHLNSSGPLRTSLIFYLNGVKQVISNPDPRMLLVDYVRDVCGLKVRAKWHCTQTKVFCRELKLVVVKVAAVRVLWTFRKSVRYGCVVFRRPLLTLSYQFGPCRPCYGEDCTLASEFLLASTLQHRWLKCDHSGRNWLKTKRLPSHTVKNGHL